MAADRLRQDVWLSERLDFLREAVAATAALDAASRLGVLARLQRGPADAQSLARDCAIRERGAHVLLAALAGLGLIELDGDGTYSATTPNLAGIAALRARWDHLAEVMRGGQPVLAGEIPSDAQALYPDVVQYLATLFASAAERAADHLGGPVRHVLDIGAGAAPWSIALARRHPACIVTAVDLPAIVPVTRQAVAVSGLDRQFRYVGGDVLTLDWESSTYDLAIVGNLCHIFDVDTNRRLLSHLLDALVRGGRLAIVDALPTERGDGPRSVVLYALGLLLRTLSGQVYPFSTYAGWLREVGFETVERFDLTASGSISLITARRP